MRIVVTGATGFIGQHLVPRLLTCGHSVIAIARDETKARAFDWFDKVEFVFQDLTQFPDDVVKHLGDADAVMHLAWPGLPNFKAAIHFETALPISYNFLKRLVASGIRHVLVAGTCLEYGMQSGSLSETGPTTPSTAYGVAKDCLRRFLQLMQADTAFTLQWARLFYIYGAGQQPNSLLAQVDHAIDRGDFLFNMSGGEQLRDYLPVERVASYLASLVQHPQFRGVINVCSGTPISVRSLVERHVAKRGSAIKLNLGHYPYPDYEPMAFWGELGQLSALPQSDPPRAS